MELRLLALVTTLTIMLSVCFFVCLVLKQIWDVLKLFTMLRNVNILTCPRAFAYVMSSA